MHISKGFVNPKGFDYLGNKVLVPDPVGFRIRPLLRYRPEGDPFTLGSMTTRVKTDQVEWSVMIGLGRSPVDSQPYIRTALVKRATAHDFGRPVGLYVDGDPIHAARSTGSRLNLMNYLFDKDVPAHEEAWRVLQGVFGLLESSGDLYGNRVGNPKAIGEHFLNGNIDRAVVSSLHGGFGDLVKSVSPDSIEQVADLCYETALGINYDDAYTGPTILVPESSAVLPKTNQSDPNQTDMVDLLRLADLATSYSGGCGKLFQELVRRIHTYGHGDLDPNIWVWALAEPEFTGQAMVQSLPGGDGLNRVWFKRGNPSGLDVKGKTITNHGYRSGGIVITLPGGDGLGADPDYGGESPPPYAIHNDAGGGTVPNVGAVDGIVSNNP
jgi:hypothetical protein